MNELEQKIAGLVAMWDVIRKRIRSLEWEIHVIQDQIDYDLARLSEIKFRPEQTK